MRVVNAYTVRPCDIEAGDVMLFVVKAMVVRDGVYRLYRCKWEGKEIPQGERIGLEASVAEALFPSLAQLAYPDPW